MRDALRANAWMLQIKRDTVITGDHVREFFTLWMLTHDFHIDDDVEDDIVWKHSMDGIYSVSTAYKAQFLGLTLSHMDFMVWKAWAPPKVKFFTWLALQGRIWTADRLERRGWADCGLCPLCKREQETAVHLFVRCRYSTRLWNMVIQKFGLAHMDTTTWHLHASLFE